MKFISDVIAHGLAISISIATLALAVDVKQDEKTSPFDRQPRQQALNDLQPERNDLKNDRKKRRLERRDRRNDRREGKPERSS